MSVTRIVISTKPKRKRPQVGDRKFIRGIEYVRRQVIVNGREFLMRDGRPVLEWVRA